MKQDFYPRLNETVFSHISANGLKTFIFPKKGFHRAFAMLAVNYGSIDAHFEADQKQMIPPKGVAHFLEHKMFEQPGGGNALQIFARTGALPNAFTSKTMTAYHFTCTDHFDQNLEVLLDFVTTPYFTDENVKKEQGIIGQEIGMVSDKPHWRVFENLMSALYSINPARDSIIGTKESISQITRGILLDCYHTFYNPSNMALIVAGDVNPEKIIQAAESILPKTYIKPPKRDYGAEPSQTAKKSVEEEMETALPVFSLGFRSLVNTGSAAGMRIHAIAELAAELLAGNSSSLYAGLYHDGLINNNFGGGAMFFPDSLCMMFSGESRDPGAVRDALLQSANELSNGIDDKYFNRVKKSYYGMSLRSLDTFDALCREQASAAFSGYMYFDLIQELEKIEIRDIINFICDTITKDKMALSVITPKKNS